MKSPDEIVQALMAQLEGLPIIGLLLHHKVMTRDAFEFLDQILCELRRCSVVRFHTFQTLFPLVAGSQMVHR